MKTADLLLALALGVAAAAACSANGRTARANGSGGKAGSSSSGGSAGTSSGGAGGTDASTSSGGSAGAAASGGTAGSASGGAAGSTGTGGSAGTTGGGTGPGGAGSFDAGISDANDEAKVGDGGTGIIIGPGADSSSPGKFGGADNPSAKPQLVYPANGVMVPPNMNSIEFHFIPAAGQTLFEFTFHAPTTNLKIYTGCTPVGSGCVFTPDQNFWSELVAYARGTVPVTYTLRGVNGANPGNVGTSVQQTIIFSQNDITGGIYYWNTKGVIQRYDFGYPGKAAEQYLTPVMAGAATCVGCHVLSRDGSKIAVGKDIPSPAPYTVFDVATRKPFYANGQAVTGQSNFFSFSPNGNYLLTSGGVNIGWRSLVTGQVLGTSIAKGTMPDWSPDGTTMVYAKPKTAPFFPVPGVSSASLELLHFTGSGWGSPQTLVPYQGQNNYYPAYSPTGNWVAFNRSPGDHESYANATGDPEAGVLPDGQLWVVSKNAGTPIQLSKATGGKACSWPKWAPVLQKYYAGQVMWLTFSSQRAYGLRLADGERTQLWMVAFDPALAAAGKDPSFPAFWLPFQDITGGNHIAQWVTQVARKPCTATSQCETREQCVNGVCVPVPQ